jgi:putative ABC transport system permease protein
MKITDSLKRSGRNLRSAKARTLLTAMAIAVGAFTLALTLAAGNGLRSYADKLVKSNFDPAELIVGRDPQISNNGTPSQKPQVYDDSVSSLNMGGPNSSLQVKQVTAQDITELQKLPYAEQVRENYQINIRYVTRTGQKKYTGSADAYNPAQKPEVKAGTLPASGDITKGEILLPESYVASLGFNDDQEAVGKDVQINVQQPFSPGAVQSLISTTPITQINPDSLKPQEKTFTYRISAVTKPASTLFNIGVAPLKLNSEDALELYDYTQKGTANYNKYLYVNVRVKDGTDQAKIEAAQADLTGKGYYTQSAKDTQQQITQFVNVLQVMVGVFGLITVIASIFGIINTQYISVLERTREVGLMKALGMGRRSVSRLFVFEAIWIGFIGGLIGVCLALLAGTLLNPVIAKKIDLSGSKLLIFAPLQLVLLIVALMLVAAVAGLLPARKAAKLDPIVALRTE